MAGPAGGAIGALFSWWLWCQPVGQRARPVRATHVNSVVMSKSWITSSMPRDGFSVTPLSLPKCSELNGEIVSVVTERRKSRTRTQAAPHPTQPSKMNQINVCPSV